MAGVAAEEEVRRKALRVDSAAAEEVEGEDSAAGAEEKEVQAAPGSGGASVEEGRRVQAVWRRRVEAARPNSAA